MTFDFDTPIDRRGTNCEKWDCMEELFGVSPYAPDNGLAMWVADMDFASPPAVKEAFISMAEHGIYGYSPASEQYHDAICGWMQRRHNWKIQPEWISSAYGVVVSLNMIVQAFCRAGDGIIIQSPVYYPFYNTVTNNGCHVVLNPLIKDNSGIYRMDLESLAKQVDENTRMLLLCNPQNPGGRVWNREELEAIAEFCLDRDIIIVSDEIHHDLVYSGNKHTVMAGISKEIADKTITCTSATKTFNIAGTMTGNVIISNPSLRRRFVRQLHRCGMYLPNSFGIAGATAAYTHGDAWLDALLPYLQNNRDLIKTRLAEYLPKVSTMELQATYLSWLDFSQLGIPMDDITHAVKNTAKLALNEGKVFGCGGENSLRLNFACPTATLETALQRLITALK